MENLRMELYQFNVFSSIRSNVYYLEFIGFGGILKLPIETSQPL
jgi:hypothetical protein